MENWMLILIFALVATGSGFVQSSLGFGYAVVALSILPYFMDVRLVNLALSLSVILPTALAIRAYRHELDWPELGWALAGGAMLLPVGLLTFAYLGADELICLTGFAILIVSLYELRLPPRREDLRYPRCSSALAGAVSGFLAGAVGIGGPPVAAYAIRQPWSPNRFKAFLLGFSLVLSLGKAVGVLAGGWVDRPVLLFTAIAAPFALLGVWLGIAVTRRIDVQRFRRRVLAMLILASVGMILRSRASLLPPLAHFPASTNTFVQTTPLADGKDKSFVEKVMGDIF